MKRCNIQLRKNSVKQNEHDSLKVSITQKIIAIINASVRIRKMVRQIYEADESGFIYRFEDW